MVQSEIDTIVAETTPRGRGGVGVVRISGPKTCDIAKQILKKIPPARQGQYLSFLDNQGNCIDEGIALLFKAPHSFTGEDVLELQGHGSPIIMDCLVKTAVAAGARLAMPGEFSLRAFLNNKLDLLQAEAISDLINANSLQAARGALRSLQGVFSEMVNTLVADLINLRMYVEATIDFPEEEIDFLSDGKIEKKLNTILDTVKQIRVRAEQGALMSSGINVAIIGRPNAGKSSLLNALSGYDRAIVTDIPGTTRDVLRESIVMDGLLVQLVDTAGLRMDADIVEKEGIQRALKEIGIADHIILVVDGTKTSETHPDKLFPEWIESFPAGIGITVLYNKIDKLNISANRQEQPGYTVLSVSIKTGEGLDALKAHLKKAVGFSSEEGEIVARRRHLEALKIAEHHLLQGHQQLVEFKAGELLAEELRQAQLALDQITGKFTTDDLLGKIFSEFCIGK